MGRSTVLLLLALITGASCHGLQDDLTGIHVQRNQFVNGNEKPVTLRGMVHLGTEYACITGVGIFDGPANQTLVDDYKAWNANAIRLPLNEDCWLGINDVVPKFSGSNYQNAIHNLTKLFTDAGMVVILDLDWTAPGGSHSDSPQPMPNMNHSVELWKSVATSFKNHDKVFFELFNEPYPDGGAWDSEGGWECWRDGGSCPGLGFQAAGMKTLLNAVRSTGASNVILLGGLAWSNSLKQWLKYVPTDPINNTAASWHSYSYNVCSKKDCWESSVGVVKQQYPVVTTEFGENDCADGYVTELMDWMDSKNISYLASTFNDWDCNHGPGLIKDYNNGGTPTNYGKAIKKHYC